MSDCCVIKAMMTVMMMLWCSTQIAAVIWWDIIMLMLMMTIVWWHNALEKRNVDGWSSSSNKSIFNLTLTTQLTVHSVKHITSTQNIFIFVTFFVYFLIISQEYILNHHIIISVLNANLLCCCYVQTDRVFPNLLYSIFYFTIMQACMHALISFFSHWFDHDDDDDDD